MIDELNLEKANAKAIVALGINAEAFTEEMPKSAKDINSEAHEIVSFAIDTWTDEGVRPDSKDEDEAAVGEALAEIFEVAGIEVDDEGGIEIGEQPEVDVSYDKDEEEWIVNIGDAPEDDDSDDEDEDGDEEDGEDDDAAVDIDDIIEGYADLSDATKLKKIKALKLDPEEDEGYNTLVAIEEFENGEDKPSTKVLNLIESLLPADDEEGDEDEDGEEDDADDETADEAGDEGDDEDGDDEPYTEEELKELDKDDLKKLAAELGVEVPKRVTDKGIQRMIDGILEAQEGEGDEEDGDDDEPEAGYEEPWDGYDKAKLADIKAVINEDGREQGEITYCLEYEEQREKPRASVVKALKARLKEFEDEDGEDEEEPKRGRGRAKAKPADDPSEDVDDAVARDDAADERKSRRSSKKKASVKVDEDDVPEGYRGAFVQSKLAEKVVREAGLSEPSDFEGDMPELPNDIDAVDHSDLSNLLLGLQNAHATAIWQASKAYIEADIYEEIAEYLRKQAVLETDESNDAKRRADAETSPLYLAWQGQHKAAYHRYVLHRDLARTIEGKIKVLSRVGGFKDDEQESGDRNVGAKRSNATKPAVKAKAAPVEEVEEEPAAKPAAKRTTRKAPAKTASKPAATKTTTRRTRRK